MTYRSRPLLDLARGQDCRANVPNICNANPETVVSCHYPEAAGMGHKQPDWRIAFCCSACHDFIDARTHKDAERSMRLWYWNVAHNATMEYLFSAGLVHVGQAPREKAYKQGSKILPRRGVA
jgi:hypothetical protein